MRKLKLQPEKLTVDSFATSHGDAGRGTAHAYGDTAAIATDPPANTGPLCPGETSVCTAGDTATVGPTVDIGFHTASCTQCDTCNGATC